MSTEQLLREWGTTVTALPSAEFGREVHEKARLRRRRVLVAQSGALAAFVALGAVTAVALAAPSKDSIQPASPPSATVSVPPSAVEPEGCQQSADFAALCRVVAAAQSGDPTGLSSTEQAVVASMGDYTQREWTINGCGVMDDDTSNCQIQFTTRTGSEKPGAAFILRATNAVYDSLRNPITSPPGAPVEFEVVEFLGFGENGAYSR